MTLPDIVKVVSSDEEFDTISEKYCPVVVLSDASKELEYEQQDASFANTIDEVLCSLMGPGSKDRLYYQNYDWWPTKTRFLSVERTAMSASILEALLRTLTGDFETWVINIHLYESLAKADEVHVGALNLYRNSILITESVLEIISPFLDETRGS
ncbi:MAG: hypothetical protein ACK578_03460 [Pirellula sp.]|jgi:hypothetical protein